MNKLISLALRIGAGIVIIALLFWLLRPGKQVEFVRSLDATPEHFERIYSGIQAGTHTRTLTDSSKIFRPMTIRLYNDHIYVSDFTDFTIYEYDSSGNQTNAIETGRGRGPGEFQNLTDFDLIRDTLWAVDSVNLTITSFSLETGEFIANTSVDRRPYRITCLEDGFIVQWAGTEQLFSKYDYDGNELHQFGELIENQLMHMFSVGGNIRSNREGRFVYIPSFASLIYHYEGNGELINVLKAPDGLEFPITRREGPRTFAPEHRYMRDGWLDDHNNLFVYTRLPGERQVSDDWEGEPVGFIDKYNLVDGEYKQSIRLDFDFVPWSAHFDMKNSVLYSGNRDGQTFIHHFEDQVIFN